MLKSLQQVKSAPDPTPQAEVDRTAPNGPINLEDAFIYIYGERWTAKELLTVVAS